MVLPNVHQQGVFWFANGLEDFKTRNDAMFKVALVMVDSPELLVPAGFDLEKDPASQLFSWLCDKHNGYSEDFPGPENADLDFWRRECGRVVKSAREARTSGITHPFGIYLLSDSEWKIVFGLGDVVATEYGFRYRLESYTANVLRKAKASVLWRGSGPDPDGTYSAEIASRWLRKIPFGKETVQRKKYQAILREAGMLKLEMRGSKEAGRANIYSGFPLDFSGPRPRLPFSPSDMARIAGSLGTESPLVEYVLVTTQRYSKEELLERYGRSGFSFLTNREQRIASIGAKLAQGPWQNPYAYRPGLPVGHESGIRSPEIGPLALAA
jgi:hypothetical protein